ncbi:hypothetical protein E2C01_016096 [Portunus trituberculatus]|uniref:Uncharacterized protein n=1 Tax=Portunus trituberculatus TaxID=210409 RepID=A0A5B7DPP7_PORTR|nr:hypothetical protein [Portunus trituberculatus]
MPRSDLREQLYGVWIYRCVLYERASVPLSLLCVTLPSLFSLLPPHALIHLIQRARVSLFLLCVTLPSLFSLLPQHALIHITSPTELAWSVWSGCSTSCDGGVRVRSYRCLPDQPLLEACVHAGIETQEQQTCNLQPCPPTHAPAPSAMFPDRAPGVIQAIPYMTATSNLSRAATPTPLDQIMAFPITASPSASSSSSSYSSSTPSSPVITVPSASSATSSSSFSSSSSSSSSSLFPSSTPATPTTTTRDYGVNIHPLYQTTSTASLFSSQHGLTTDSSPHSSSSSYSSSSSFPLSSPSISHAEEKPWKETSMNSIPVNPEEAPLTERRLNDVVPWGTVATSSAKRTKWSYWYQQQQQQQQHQHQSNHHGSNPHHHHHHHQHQHQNQHHHHQNQQLHHNQHHRMRHHHHKLFMQFERKTKDGRNTLHTCTRYFPQPQRPAKLQIHGSTARPVICLHGTK